MKIALYSRDGGAMTDPRLSSMLDKLEKESFMIYETSGGEDLLPGTDLVMSVGGDGTFLSAARCVGASGVPILGVNLGRLGFLSEYSPEEACGALLSGAWYLEDRELLETEVDGSLSENPALSASAESFCPFTLNEVSVHRSGAALLGVDVTIDGHPLPTYWADGLIVATSLGSTAYSLSAGGPIVFPGPGLLMLTPIAPHNLNVRPLIIPLNNSVRMKFHSRDSQVVFSADNVNFNMEADAEVSVSLAGFSLKRVRLCKSNFVNALTSKLHWGEDIRNSH